MSFKASGTKTRPERVKPVLAADPTLTSSQTRSRRTSTTSIASTSSTASFHSTHSQPNRKPLRFTPSVEALHLDTSNTLKSEANTHFGRGDFSSALSTYDRAIGELPTYLDYELAVLQSNVAACHLRLSEWKDAVQAAEKGWTCLETLDPTEKKRKTDKTDEVEGTDDKIVELPTDDDNEEDEATILQRLNLSDQRRNDIRRIRTKLLLRRARARYMLGTSSTPTTKDKDKDNGNPFSQAAALTSSSDSPSTSQWSNLSAALTDYKLLSEPRFFSNLPSSDQKTVRSALAVLPGLAEQAKEKEVADMMGKLKDLGNGILRPFGLSTDMFKMDKDPVSGGMSLRFEGGKK